MKIQAIVTLPPYAPFLEEVCRHPLVAGVRLNTVMPLREPPIEVLRRLAVLGPPLWVDLKGRQLRVAAPAIPPYTEVLLGHPIAVETPVDVFFSDGRERVRAAAVDGRRLILEDGPRRLVGPGESLNIVHESLRVEGLLTETDVAYLEAMRTLGLCRVMLSFAEGPADVAEVRRHLPYAELILKIESRRGLAFAGAGAAAQGRLLAARGDLFVEVLRPHRIAGALKAVIQADPAAVVASRMLESLLSHPVPSCADIGDVAFLLELGYRTFMPGDSLCFRRETVLEALNLLQAVAQEFS